MAKIKRNELKNMEPAELEKNLSELRKEFMKLKSQARMGTSPENPGRIREIRRMAARISMIMKNKGAGKRI